MASDCWTYFLNSELEDNDSTRHNVPMPPKLHNLSSKELNLTNPATKDFIMIVDSVCVIHINPSVMLGRTLLQEQSILALHLLQLVEWDSVPHACHLAAHNR